MLDLLASKRHATSHNEAAYATKAWQHHHRYLTLLECFLALSIALIITSIIGLGFGNTAHRIVVQKEDEYVNNFTQVGRKIPEKQLQSDWDVSNSSQGGSHNGKGAAGTRLPDFHCLNHFQSNLNEIQRTQLKKGVPILSSIVPTRSGIEIVFIMKHIAPKYNQWYKALWQCSLAPAVMLGRDSHSHTLMIQCPSSISMIQVRGAKYTIPSNFCPWTSQPAHVSACTMVKGQEAQAKLPEWIAYHRVIGIEQFYVYVNEEMVKPSFYHESVHWVPFQDNFNKPFFVQQAMQNDCIARARFQSNWLALLDVDEYFQLMDGSGAISNILQPFEDKSIGGISIKNIFCGSNPEDADGADEQQSLVIDRFIWRAPQTTPSGREKLIVQPTHVKYISVHEITLGNPKHTMDPQTEIRMNHYKLPVRGVYGNSRDPVHDDSMRKYVKQVTQELSLLTRANSSGILGESHSSVVNSRNAVKKESIMTITTNQIKSDSDLSNPDSADTPEIHFRTYGDHKYPRSKKRIVKEAMESHWFKTAKALEPNDLSKAFREKYREILALDRGGGYWIWKFDVFEQAMSMMREGDFLVYLDAGSQINKHGKKRFYEYIEMVNNSKYDMLGFQIGHLEHIWTAHRLLSAFNITAQGQANITHTGQIEANTMLLQKGPHYRRWIKLCKSILEMDPWMITDKYNEEAKTFDPLFKDNRHDQSIMSLSRKILGYVHVSSGETHGQDKPFHVTRKRS